MPSFKYFLQRFPVINLPYKVYRGILCYRVERKTAERMKNRLYGLYPNRKAYIIRRDHKAGFFSNFFFVLGHIIYADKKGWDIFVDMEHYPTLYNEKEGYNGKRNAWEYYFQQPCKLSLRDGYCYKHQIMSSGSYLYDEVPYYEGLEKRFPNERDCYPDYTIL